MQHAVAFGASYIPGTGNNAAPVTEEKCLNYFVWEEGREAATNLNA